MFGGPIQLDRGFVLHRPVGEWQSTMVVNQGMGLTTSLDILRGHSKWRKSETVTGRARLFRMGARPDRA